MDEWSIERVPPFEAGDTAFPEGRYILIFGQLNPVVEDNEVVAVVHDIWVVKYKGPVNGGVVFEQEEDIRISVKDGEIVFPKQQTRGLKIVERYPNPKIMRKLAWKAGAFFSHFEDTMEVDKQTGVKYVSWQKAAKHYGRVFSADIIYRLSGTRRYRNLDYGSVEVTGFSFSPDEMKKIETLYKSLKDLEESSQESGNTPASADDLPF